MPPSKFTAFFRTNWIDKVVDSLGIHTKDKKSNPFSLFSTSKKQLSNESLDSESLKTKSHILSKQSTGSDYNAEVTQIFDDASVQQPHKAPKVVRFAFPAVYIASHQTEANESDLVGNPVDIEVAVNSNDVDSLACEAPLQPSSSDANATADSHFWAELIDVDRPSRNSSTFNTNSINQSDAFTPLQIHKYYMQIISHPDHGHIPILDLALQQSIKANAFPTTLDLTGVQLSLAHVRTLSLILQIDVGLKTLILENCGLTNEALKQLLVVIIPNISKLERLSIAGNPLIDAHGIKYISSSIRKTVCIKSVDLSGIALDGKGAAYLGYAIASENASGLRQACMERLHLDKTRLELTYLKQIVNGVRRSRLKLLSLSGNDLDESVADVFPFLVGNGSNSMNNTVCRLENLNLSDNRVGAGIIRMCGSLENNSSLVELNLSNNQITNAGLVQLAGALCTNQTLKKLDLSHNQLFSENELDGVNIDF